MLLFAVAALVVVAVRPETGPSPSRSTVDPTAAGATAGGGAPSPPKVKPTVYWGAQVGSQLTGHEAPWDMAAVTQFEAETKKPLSLIAFAAPFSNCFSTCVPYSFDRIAFDNIRNHGALPFFTWGTDSVPWNVSEPNFQLADVIGGRYDDFITNWATDAKNWGHPFFLRFDHEMNGNWSPWSEGVNGNQSGQFVDAWHHVHDIFTSVGATNAAWVWCPNIDPFGLWTPLAGLYPGDDYVDWTCLDGYNWAGKTTPHQPTTSEWLTFDQLYSSTYHEIVDTIAPTKPMIIGEVGSSEVGGSKAEWITDMLSVQLPANYPKVKGFVWTESNVDEMDWPIESSPAAQAAFALAVQHPRYAGNEFGRAAPPLPTP